MEPRAREQVDGRNPSNDHAIGDETRDFVPYRSELGQSGPLELRRASLPSEDVRYASLVRRVVPPSSRAHVPIVGTEETDEDGIFALLLSEEFRTHATISFHLHSERPHGCIETHTSVRVETTSRDQSGTRLSCTPAREPFAFFFPFLPSLFLSSLPLLFPFEPSDPFPVPRRSLKKIWSRRSRASFPLLSRRSSPERDRKRAGRGIRVAPPSRIQNRSDTIPRTFDPQPTPPTRIPTHLGRPPRESPQPNPDHVSWTRRQGNGRHPVSFSLSLPRARATRVRSRGRRTSAKRSIPNLSTREGGTAPNTHHPTRWAWTANQ